MYETHWRDLVRCWSKAPASCRERVLEEILDGKGVPTYIRSNLWMTASGAEKKMESFPNVYQDYLAEASRRLESSEPTDFTQVELQIRKDIKRTYPLFLRNAANAYGKSASNSDESTTSSSSSKRRPPVSSPPSPTDDQHWQQHERALYNVLCACALASGPKEASYHQGLNYMAALLLILMHERPQSTTDVLDPSDIASPHSAPTRAGLDVASTALSSPTSAPSPTPSAVPSSNSQGYIILSSLKGDKDSAEATAWRNAETRAFWILQSLLEDYNLSGIYDCHTSFLQQYLDQFDLLVRRFLPRLHRHLEHGLQGGYPVVLFAMDWFTTVFSYSMRMDAVYLIWDLFIVTRLDETLYVAGLGILLHLRDRLMAISSFEEMADQFKSLVRSISARELLLCIKRVVERIVPSELIPPGRSTLANIERAIHDSSNELTTSEFDATQLVRAVQLGDAPSTELELAKYKFPVQMLERLLLRAVMLGHAAVVKTLLSVCDASCRSSIASLEGLTPLHLCAIMGHPTVARVLLSAGADRSLRSRAPVLNSLLPASDYTQQTSDEHRTARKVDVETEVAVSVSEYGMSAAELARTISLQSSIMDLATTDNNKKANRKRPTSHSIAHSAVHQVLDGNICLACGRFLQRRANEGSKSFFSSIMNSLTPDWDEAVPRANNKLHSWDGDLCSSCADQASRDIILDAPMGSLTWHCVNCKTMLLGERKVQCRRCQFWCCSACTFTRRQLLPKYKQPVPVCVNCHHVLRSCPCDESSWRSYQVKCDHQPTDNLGPGGNTCSCEQCLRRRFTLREPAQHSREARYDSVRPLFNAKEALAHGFWASQGTRSPLEVPATSTEVSQTDRDVLTIIGNIEKFVTARTQPSRFKSRTMMRQQNQQHQSVQDAEVHGSNGINASSMKSVHTDAGGSLSVEKTSVTVDEKKVSLDSSDEYEDDQEHEASTHREAQADIQDRKNFEPLQRSYRDFHAELVEFYTVWNPSQISKVDVLLSKYKGREEELLNSLHKMYAKR